MTYTVEYKLPGHLLWRRLRRVKGDLIDQGTRVVILEDERQVHLPLTAVVRFSRERYEIIKNRVSNDAGQPVQVRS